MSHRKRTTLFLLFLAAFGLACQTVTGILFPENATPLPTSTTIPTFPPDYTPPAPTPTGTLVPVNQDQQKANI